MSTSSSSSAEDLSKYSEIVTKQREYFEKGHTLSVDMRKVRLMRLKQLVEENSGEMTEAVFKDLRKLPGYTKMEMGYVVQEVDYVINQLDVWTSTNHVSKTIVNCFDEPMIVKQPLGVILIIAPWNYPLDMILRPLIPVIAAGNTAIIKPSELAVHSAEIIAKLIPKYLPAELVTVINGGVEETTSLLKQRFDHIFYTGSTAVGKIIMTAAAQNLTPVTLELGGKSPAVVLSDAKMDVTASRIAWGKWTNAGQTCVAPDYVIVTEQAKEALVDELKKSLTSFYGENIRESRDYGRIINKRHYNRLSNLLDKSQGTLLFVGSERDPDDLFFPPIIVDVSKGDALMEEEIFGPILPIVTVPGLPEAIQLINSKERPLAAYIFTTNDKSVEKMIKETYSGGVCVNDVIVHILLDTLPFGGVGHSGMGRYHGKFGFDTFTHEKSVLKRQFFGESLMAVRYPPLTDRKEKTFQSLAVRRPVPGVIGWISSSVSRWFCD